MQDLETPLYGAARNGHVEAVRLLLEAKADVNAQDEVSTCLVVINT